MTVTRVNANFGSSTSTSGATLTLPTGWAADDFCLVFFVQRFQGGVITPPAGWTAIPNGQIPASLNDGFQSFYRKLQAGDANPAFTWSNFSSFGTAFVIVAYRGQSLSFGPFDPSQSVTASWGTTIGPSNMPANRARTRNLMLVHAVGVLNPTRPTVTVANGFTDVGGIGSGGGLSDAIELLDKYVTDGDSSQNSATLTTAFGGWSNFVGLSDAVQPNKFSSAQGSTSGAILRTDFPKPRIGTQTFNGGSNLTLPIPAGTLVGDAMIAAIVGDGFSVTAPAGWTSKGRVSEPNTARPLDVFTRKYQAGDANPTFTLGHSSARNYGVIVSFENGDTYDHDVTGQAANVADHAGPLLTGLDDAYNYIIQFNLRYYDGENATLTDLKPGSEFGFSTLARYTSTGAGWGIGLTIYGRQQLGAANVQGPTVTRAGGGAGAIRLVQVQAFHQPVYIDAAIQQGSTGTVAMHQDVGYPIEVHMQEANHLTVNMRTSFARRKPQRELVWIHNYSGERIGVID